MQRGKVNDAWRDNVPILGRAKRSTQHARVTQYDLAGFAHGLAAVFSPQAVVDTTDNGYHIKLPGEELELAISHSWQGGKFTVAARWPQSKTSYTKHLADIQVASERKQPLSMLVPRVRNEVLQPARAKLPRSIQEEDAAIAAGKAFAALREQFVADYPEIDLRYDKNHGWEFKSRSALDRNYQEPYASLEGRLQPNGLYVDATLKIPLEFFAEFMAILRMHRLIPTREESRSYFREG